MKEKLSDLLKSEGLKPGQFAEMLGINPAGVSHILAGRNKPGFDLLQKILRRFPQVNPDWLLLDSPQMYRDDEQPSSFTPAPPASDLFSAAEPTSSRIPAPTPHTAPQQPAGNSASGIRDEFPTDPHKTIARVVVFYTDQTFDSYLPAQQRKD